MGVIQGDTTLTVAHMTKKQWISILGCNSPCLQARRWEQVTIPTLPKKGVR